MRRRVLWLAVAALVAGTTAALLPPGPGCRAAEAATPAPLAVGAQYHGLWSGWTDAERAGVLDRLAAAGVTWVRMDVGWSAMEEEGSGRTSAWYLDRTSRWVDAARARGLRVLVTLWSTPEWANGGRGVEVPPTDPAEYARVAGELARRFRGRVAAWEVWNEPNSDDFFAGDAATYVGLLRRAHPAIKAADPAATVVLGGPSYNDTAWLAAAYAAGAEGSFDVMATHPYLGRADAPPETPDDGTVRTLAHVAAVRELMVANGDAARPIWFTELGWSSHANDASTPAWARGVTPERQADYLVRTLELVAARHPYVTHVFWYAARDRTDAGTHENNFGLLTCALDEKPAYRALRDHLRGVDEAAPADAKGGR